MIFKLTQSAARGWRKLGRHQHIPALIKGVCFTDGMNEEWLDGPGSLNTKFPGTHTKIVC